MIKHLRASLSLLNGWGMNAVFTQKDEALLQYATIILKSGDTHAGFPRTLSALNQPSKARRQEIFSLTLKNRGTPDEGSPTRKQFTGLLTPKSKSTVY